MIDEKIYSKRCIYLILYTSCASFCPNEMKKKPNQKNKFTVLFIVKLELQNEIYVRRTRNRKIKIQVIRH
jgi:hypothetical protein